MADADVHAAEPADAAEIARIQLTTWRTAYAELVPADVLDALDESEAERAWCETIAEGPASVWIATEGSWAAGFCAAGPAPVEEVRAADGTAPPDANNVGFVSALLVEPRWGRRGHGGRLLATAARSLASGGAGRGITWVPEADSASMAFFRRVGWDPDGTVRTLEAGGRPLREMRLSGSLDLHLREPS